LNKKNNQANPDEAKRAAFAAEEHILSEEYQGSGLDFFFICREKISIPLEKLARWLLEAPTEQKKGNGLRYLLDGEHGEKVASILRERGLGGSWLVGLRPDSPCFIGWDENDILEIFSENCRQSQNCIVYTQPQKKILPALILHPPPAHCIPMTMD